MNTLKSMVTVVLITFCLLGSASVALGAPKGLVAYWPLDGDLVDASGNGYDGELVAGEFVEDGLYGGALYCGGEADTSFAQIPNIVPELKKGAFSVTLWFNREGGDGVIGAWAAADSANAWYNGHGFNARVYADGHLYLSNYTRTGDNYDIMSDPGFYEDGEWTHLAVTQIVIGGGFSTLTGYINGEEILTGTGHEFIGHDSGHIVLGSRTNNGRNLFEGKIDDVALFDRVLTAGEILGIMPGMDVEKSISPTPGDGKTEVKHDNVVLSWTPGETAVSHDLYLGEDFNDVNTATPDSDLFVVNQTETTYPLEGLTYGKTYYWRIDDVNDAEPNSPIKGDIWSFTTANFIVLEDFEDYNDFEPDTVWNTWSDGYGIAGNGSSAGYPDPDFVEGEHYLEDSIVHGGAQSMPLFYDNSTAPISEVSRTFSAPLNNWTVDDVVTLTLFYHGDPDNAAESMFVVVDGAVVVNDDANAALVEEWIQWDIPLQEFADQGVNLNSVGSLTIGFGNKANPVAGGGDGNVKFDDLRLYRE